MKTIYSICGSAGVGKTTLLKNFFGEHKPDAVMHLNASRDYYAALQQTERMADLPAEKQYEIQLGLIRHMLDRQISALETASVMYTDRSIFDYISYAIVRYHQKSLQENVLRSLVTVIYKNPRLSELLYAAECFYNDKNSLFYHIPYPQPFTLANLRDGFRSQDNDDTFYQQWDAVLKEMIKTFIPFRNNHLYVNGNSNLPEFLEATIKLELK